MLAALLLLALFGIPGLALLATARGNGAAAWPWTRGVAVAAAVGVLVAGLSGVALGVLGIFGPLASAATVTAVTLGVVLVGRFRLAWPFTRSSAVEAAGFVAVAALACAVFLGRPFEMLIGGRDATVYLVGGIGLAQQGSFVLHDRAQPFIGADHMVQFYPTPDVQRSRLVRSTVFVKYPGFYFVDPRRGEIIAQGLPLFPALVALFYTYGGLHAAFSTAGWVGVLAVLAVFAAGSSLYGALPAAIGSSPLTSPRSGRRAIQWPRSSCRCWCSRP